MRSVFKLLKQLTRRRAHGGGLHGSLKVELRRAGSTKVVHEQRMGATLSTRDGVWRQEELMIDREVDRYLHRILDPDGTVVHHDESTLTAHRGHGSAKKRKASSRGHRHAPAHVRRL